MYFIYLIRWRQCLGLAASIIWALPLIGPPGRALDDVPNTFALTMITTGTGLCNMCPSSACNGSCTPW